MSEPLSDQLKSRDFLLLAGFCAVLFGFSMVSGRPLSVHESVLPQSSREMFADRDFIVPKKGGAPWLESPPLPQWVTVGVASLFGRCDKVWIARMGPTLVSACIVLMVAWMAARWFGRNIGLLSGFIMATTCNFTRYAWLAEDEIYLCGLVTAAMALFVRLEFTDCADNPSPGFVRSFLGRRPWLVFAFFVALGLTNLVKGLLFGTAMVVIPIAGFLLWNADLRRIGRYVWLWGWLAFLIIVAAWPVAAYLRHPDALVVWNFDLGGRLSGDYAAISEPLWYYPVNLLWILAPWTLVIPFGLWVTRKSALKQRYSPERFLWCWALLVPAVFSLASGKHHHYLLHCIAPWAVIASFGLVRARQWLLSWPRRARHPLSGLLTIALPTIIALVLLRPTLPGPGWITNSVILGCPLGAVGLVWLMLHKNPRFAARGVFAVLLVTYCFGHSYAGAYVDKHRKDAAFLEQVRNTVPPAKQLLVDMSVGALRGFHCMFYLEDNTVALHNLSFLVDDRIHAETYVVTRYARLRQLQSIGEPEVVLQSEKTGGGTSAQNRLTLFHLKYRQDIPRISSAGVKISPMQSMYRTEGPFLR